MLTAADLVSDPMKVADVDPATLHPLLTQLAALTATIAAHLGTLPAATTDRLLRGAEAADILKVSEDWLRKSPAARPLRVKLGTDGPVRYSAAAIQRYIERCRGR